MASRRRIVSEDPEEDASDVNMSLESEDGEDLDVDVESPTRRRRKRPLKMTDDDAEQMEDDDDDDEEPDGGSDLDELSPSPARDAPAPQRKLKIRLKLPQQNPSTVATPASSHRTSRDDEDDDEVESEDAGSEVDESTRSTSVVGGQTSGKMTARQAVLANVVGSSHVSLDEPASARKKKPLTEMELALKREETARKRKNLSEKKLEDEKAETINRLLKKQSRSRNKRNALSTAEDRTPQEGEVIEETIEIPQFQPVPTMYRWISTTRSWPVAEGDMQTDEPAKRMSLSFSVPLAALPQ